MIGDDVFSSPLFEGCEKIDLTIRLREPVSLYSEMREARFTSGSRRLRLRPARWPRSTASTGEGSERRSTFERNGTILWHWPMVPLGAQCPAAFRTGHRVRG